MTTYPIIGHSTGGAKVIASSLGDLSDKSKFFIGWSGDPSPGEEAVIDWLIDHERSFTVVHSTDTVPKGISRYAEACIQVNGQLTTSVVLQATIDGAKTCLVLWDESVDEDIIAASDHIGKFLELTNGLTPIEIDDSDDEPVQKEEIAKPEPVEEAGSESFSHDELATMPMAALKRQAKDRGISFSGLTKEELVEALLVSHDGTTDDDDEDEVVLPHATGTGDVEFILGLLDQITAIDQQYSEHETAIVNLCAERRSLMQKIHECLVTDTI